MSVKYQPLLAGSIGFFVGVCVGPISAFAIHARGVLHSGGDWPKLSGEYLLVLFATSVPAGLNGALGATFAADCGTRKRFTVTVFPAALHVVVGIVALLIEPQSFVGFQMYTLVFMVVIWSAGRLGQRIGCAMYCPDRGLQLCRSQLGAAKVSPDDC